MTREQASETILSLTSANILVELPTGYGKTKIALNLLNKYKPESILIVVPRLVLIQNWKEEFKKWGMVSMLKNVTFTTYVSFPKKYLTKEHWGYIVFDEAHHLSERCRDAISESENVTFDRCTLLSATVNRNLKAELPYIFKDLYTFKISMKEAIKEEVLPDPKIILVPLYLDNTNPCYEIIKGNKRSKVVIRDTFINRFKYKNEKRKVIISCTQKQYYEDMEAFIRWCKTRMCVEAFKNLYLQRCGARNKWLSDQKTFYVQKILEALKDKRTLTFCNGILHTMALGQYCINSSNKKDSDIFLNDFNQGKINHITACNILDEGCNLTDCQYGIFAMLNSSERMVIQKLGRLLRHKEPVIVIPYYVGTRDEELTRKIIEGYNSNNIKTINYVENLKLD